jgi:VWA domain-containing protein
MTKTQIDRLKHSCFLHLNLFRISNFVLRALPAAFLLLLATQAVPADDRTASTQVFGVTASGSSFVYVFDRSLSMQGPALAAAKRELLASLSHLKPVQQFQIIFYNEKPKIMPPGPLLFADDNGRRQAESFVGGITAAGGTDHVQALELAIRLQPDVIFLLTDADEPPLSTRDLKAIHQKNSAIINVIEFKTGSPTAKPSSLRQLADQNRGEYKAIDANSFSGAK